MKMKNVVIPKSAADLNALAGTDAINTYVQIANSQLNLASPEVFYNKQLLDTIRLGQDQYTYYRYAETAPIGEKADKLVMALNQFFMSLPPFLLGLALTYLFGIVFRLFTPGGYVDYTSNLFGFISYLFFPALALAIPKCAMCIRLLKTGILEEAQKDYARTAYSRGNSTTQMLYKHILKNAVMPTITFVGMVVADMIASGIIIEQVFGIPGLGRSLLSAISTRDYPVVTAIVMLIAILIVSVGFVTDIIHAMIDPRIRR